MRRSPGSAPKRRLPASAKATARSRHSAPSARDGGKSSPYGAKGRRGGGTVSAVAIATSARPRVLELLERLRTFYGVLPSPPAAAFTLYVWEVLTLGTTPKRRDAAFNALRRIPALTPDALARVPQAKLEAAVGHAGPMKDERIRALRAGVDLFRRTPSLPDDLAGPFRQAVRAAGKVPHLGRASMLRLLLFAGGHPVLPLDEHALRVARRLGYGRDSSRPARLFRTTRQAIVAESGTDPETLRAISQYFTHHGVATCVERSPHCGVCPLALDCEWLKLQ